MSIDPFRKVVLEVASGLTNQEAINLVYLYNLDREKANNVSPLNVLWTLQNRGVVSSEENLIQLLRNIEREDLATMVKGKRRNAPNRTRKRFDAEEEVTGNDDLLSALLSSASFMLEKCHSHLQSGNGRAVKLSPKVIQEVQCLYKTAVNIKGCVDCESESSDEEVTVRSSADETVESGNSGVNGKPKKEPLLPPHMKKQLPQRAGRSQTDCREESSAAATAVTKELESPGNGWVWVTEYPVECQDALHRRSPLESQAISPKKIPLPGLTSSTLETYCLRTSSSGKDIHTTHSCEQVGDQRLPSVSSGTSTRSEHDSGYFDSLHFSRASYTSLDTSPLSPEYPRISNKHTPVKEVYPTPCSDALH